jgi:hypothetical protein
MESLLPFELRFNVSLLIFIKGVGFGVGLGSGSDPGFWQLIRKVLIKKAKNSRIDFLRIIKQLEFGN